MVVNSGHSESLSQKLYKKSALIDVGSLLIYHFTEIALHDWC